jgi:hypothetical protein
MWAPSDVRHWKTVGNALPKTWRERLRFIWWMEDRFKKSLWIIISYCCTPYSNNLLHRYCWAVWECSIYNSRGLQRAVWK